MVVGEIPMISELSCLKTLPEKLPVLDVATLGLVRPMTLNSKLVSEKT